jgi:hypothetical protein
MSFIKFILACCLWMSQVACGPGAQMSSNASSPIVRSTPDLEITATVNGFWKAAVANDKEQIERYVKLPPKSFYSSCIVNPATVRDTNASEDISFRGKGQAGAGTPDMSSTDEFLLSFFIEQITKAKPSLDRVMIRKANETQALVSVDYSPAKSHPSRAEFGMLKIDGAWRIAFLPNPQSQEPVESFAADPPCQF